MITREEAFAWMDRQIDARNTMREPLGDDIENISYNVNGIHVWNVTDLAKAIGYPYIRSNHDHETDMLHFRYRGVEFFGIDFDKRIGKKVSA